MSESNITDENISSLINKILEGKDPATVGLRKIIRKKNDEQKDFPLRKIDFEEFSSPDLKKKILTDDERRILQLEKQIADNKINYQKQIESLKKQVQDSYLRGKKEGYESGEKKGKEDSAALFDKRIEELQNKISTFFSTIEESKKQIINNSEHILTRLCVEMVKKIISTELSTRNDIILSVLKKALTYIGDRERLIIRIAPDDFETVSTKKDFWFPVSERLKDIIIEKDERITKGGCIVESNTGIVDSRMGVLMDELFSIVEKTWDSVNSSNDTAPVN
ncbi:MAG: hypothetical protein GX640_18200 [Fibrobacter sp.]|nr:hypothetical protein [Fibrobacter sp.]